MCCHDHAITARNERPYSAQQVNSVAIAEVNIQKNQVCIVDADLFLGLPRRARERAQVAKAFYGRAQEKTGSPIVVYYQHPEWVHALVVTTNSIKTEGPRIPMLLWYLDAGQG
jgi:hypothetical protein